MGFPLLHWALVLLSSSLRSTSTDRFFGAGVTGDEEEQEEDEDEEEELEGPTDLALRASGVNRLIGRFFRLPPLPNSRPRHRHPAANANCSFHCSADVPTMAESAGHRQSAGVTGGGGCA